MKKLLILGGFPQMIDIVMTAKKLGIYTIVADRDPASPAKRFADLPLDLSTDKVDELTALCKKEQVNGVFTGFEDFNIHIACELCSLLGFPFYATKEQLAAVTNKLAFKEHCRSFGVPVIEQYSLEEALTEGKFPYIIKPSDSYGSRGITICHNAEELQLGHEKAVNTSSEGSAVIERFIDYDHGTELFYTIINGHIHLTATADRYTVRNGETTVPLPVAEVFPSRHAQDMMQTIDAPIRAMLTGLGIQNGLVLIQALYDGEQYFIYEMAYRFTGEQHYRLVLHQHGVSLAEMMLRLALGEDISSFDNALLDHDAFIRPSINLALILNPGTIDTITGLNDVYQIEEVISYNLSHHNKDVIQPSGDYSHMLIRVNMVADRYQDLCHAVAQVADFVRVTSDTGEDMLVTRFYLPQDPG